MTERGWYWQVGLVLVLWAVMLAGCQLLSPGAGATQEVQQEPKLKAAARAAPITQGPVGLQQNIPITAPIQYTRADTEDSDQSQTGAGLLNQFRFEILSGSGGLLLAVAVVVLILRGRTYRGDLERVTHVIRKHPHPDVLAAIGRKMEAAGRDGKFNRWLEKRKCLVTPSSIGGREGR